MIRGYLNGTTAGHAGPGCPPDRLQKRGLIDGWSPGAVRRHTKWLYSIDPDALTVGGQHGVAVTLTLRDCPQTPEEWESIRRAWITRADRLGITLLHWVVEWQARKVPHLHIAAFFPGDIDQLKMGEALIWAWLERTYQLGASPAAQTWERIDGPLGWLQYLSKHAARGVRHYQREGKPEGWDKTGRLWGHNRGWPEVEPWVLDTSWPAFWALRRLFRSWRVADARSALLAADTLEKQRAARRRLLSARHMLRNNDEKKSRGRGVSEWAGMDVLADFVELLRSQGFDLDTRTLIPAVQELESPGLLVA